jgi:hypothetical protein
MLQKIALVIEAPDQVDLEVGGIMSAQMACDGD